jgi:hypothetical protein
MAFTLGFNDFIAIAFIVAVVGRIYPDWTNRQVKEDLRMRRQVDAIMEHLGLPEPTVSRRGALSAEVVALLAEGKRVDALRRYREETGESLKEARAALEEPGAGR